MPGPFLPALPRHTVISAQSVTVPFSSCAQGAWAVWRSGPATTATPTERPGPRGRPASTRRTPTTSASPPSSIPSAWGWEEEEEEEEEEAGRTMRPRNSPRSGPWAGWGAPGAAGWWCSTCRAGDAGTPTPAPAPARTRTGRGPASAGCTRR